MAIARFRNESTGMVDEYEVPNNWDDARIQREFSMLNGDGRPQTQAGEATQAASKFAERSAVTDVYEGAGYLAANVNK